MNETVLDASVLIAIVKNERIHDGILDVIEGAVLGAVNLAEVWTKLDELGLTHDPRLKTLLNLISRIEPFTAIHARITADLRPLTRHVGLSLVDRACVALAIQLNADVYTAERVWAKIDVGCRVHLIR